MPSPETTSGRCPGSSTEIMWISSLGVMSFVAAQSTASLLTELSSTANTILRPAIGLKVEKFEDKGRIMGL